MEVFRVALRLGLTSFGGPIAHLGYFRDEYVVRRRWLDDGAYAELVALCQFLPGPASSQVGIAIGMKRAGFPGGIASWLGFTLPSALALFLFSALLQGLDVTGAGWLRGLLTAAVAVVAHAVWGMGSKLAPDRPRATMAVLAATATLLVPAPGIQVLAIILGGLFGWLWWQHPPGHEAATGAGSGAGGIRAATAGGAGGREAVPAARPEAVAQRAGAIRQAAVCWILFFLLLGVLPVAARLYPIPWLRAVDSFYRAGSLVFGGGHVVLPLLEKEVVGPGGVTAEQFIAGYGAAQAVPGPLFTFAAYLGGTMGGWPLALAATAAIFLPSFLLVAGALPYWELLRRHPGAQGALKGMNAVVVGILLAALYHPVWTKAIHSPLDFSLALAAFGLLAYWKAPAWLVVGISALGGLAISVVG